MERLHHLFAELDNCTVILAVDKKQLNKTVQQIFGSDTDTTKYLKKFINFEVVLDTGKITGSFSEKYADYFSMFDNSLFDTSFSFDMFFSALFTGIDMRTQERTMERINTVHRILFPDTKKDYSFMCIEVMWVVFNELHDLKTEMPIFYDDSYENPGFCLSNKVLPEFTEYMKNEWKGVNAKYGTEPFNNKYYTEFLSPIDIPQILIWYLWQLYPETSRIYRISAMHPKYNEFKQNVTDLQKYVALLKLIK